MRKFASLILVVLAGFFPYMPLLHAMEDREIIHCSGIHHQDKSDASHHSMSNCIEIVKKIHKTSSLDTGFLEVPTIAPPFEKYFETPPELSETPTLSTYHITDPPDTGANLTGIVRIIS